MSQPAILEIPGGYDFTWCEEKIQIKAQRAKEHKDGTVKAELNITTSAPGYGSHLHRANLNLLSSQSKASLSKLLQGIYEPANWDEVLEQVSTYIVDRIRKGEPVEVLCTDGEMSPPGYLLYPVIPLGQPTVFFGDGGSLKSLMALACIICVQLPWQENPLSFKPGSNESTASLFLDYETYSEEQRWRLKCLEQGHDLPAVMLNYRRCHSPLADDLEQIQDAIFTSKAQFIVIDSLAAATGGDLNAAEPALRFFNALRKLKVTSLIVAHNSKDPQSKKKTIYGSAFFGNYARSIFELKKTQELGASQVVVGMFHRKCNFARLSHPMAFRVTFLENSTLIEQESVQDIPEFVGNLSARNRIQVALKGGAMTADDLSAATELSKDVLKARLNELKRKGEVVKLGDKWGLAARQEAMPDN